MDTKTLAIWLLDLDSEVDITMKATALRMYETFESQSSQNEVVATESAMHNCMADFILVSRLNTKFKKLYDRYKKDVDAIANALDCDTDGVAGQTIEIHHSNTLTYSKKRNADGESISVTDLKTELARLGVEKSVVDQAVRAATKTKKGNTYYQVEAI